VKKKGSKSVYAEYDQPHAPEVLDVLASTDDVEEARDTGVKGRI
jgi:hypothetical protein